MKILNIGCFLICFVFFASAATAEKVTLTTYYPAPFGAYDRLKLVPRDSLPLEPHCDGIKDVGTMYFDNGKNDRKAGIYVCHVRSEDNYYWSFIGAPDVMDSGPMSQGKLLCMKGNGKFGTCASSPSYDGTCACQ